MTVSRIRTEIDFSADGKQVGWAHLPHSVHESAYGVIAIPLAVIRNGEGPTILLMAGNHGDEYEGQVALAKLIRRLEPGQIRGRVIILPAANFPAAMAGKRTSPIDQGNLNRTFPGDPRGTPTWMLSHWIETVLMEMADIVVDLHSGGSSLDYIPICMTRRFEDAAVTEACVAAVQAFGARYAVLMDLIGEDRTTFAAATRTRNRIVVGTEMAGKGTVGIEALEIAETGVQRLLQHFGIWQGAPLVAMPTEPPTLLEVKGVEHYVYAPDAGVFESFVDLGARVVAGQPAGQVHFIDDPMRPPALAHFRGAGLVVCKRLPGRVVRGDCVFHLASEV
ncbi:MAG: succinylglutamate desuccinylase/aspartoacylase family protein [Alphaproteobacteria bacterium]|nr:succinylglutamate desuccinylase/aspartoacylase family protein [Alphaproteobacteria bacterium]